MDGMFDPDVRCLSSPTGPAVGYLYLVAATPVMIVVLLLGLVILGGWFFSERGTNRRGAILG